MKKLRLTLSVAAAALAAVACMVACDDDETTPAAPTADAAPSVDAATDTNTPPETDAAVTGTVTGSITYSGAKTGPVVVALIQKVPDMPGGDIGALGGVAIVPPGTFPATYSVKGPPGEWFVSAYMSIGDPIHVGGPQAGDPLGPVPVKVTIVKDQTTPNANIEMIDIPEGDGGTDDAGDGG